MVYIDYFNFVFVYSVNCFGYMCIVRIVVYRIRIVVKGIDIVNIVNIIVVVIINIVFSNFIWVNLCVICKVFMIVVNICIDNVDDYIVIIGCNILCFWCVNIYICSIVGLIGVI